MKKLLVKRDDPVLRKRAQEVSTELFGSKKLKLTIDKMKKALYQEEDGVAIAAPQVGEGLRIFMVRADIVSSLARGDLPAQDLIFVNPQIVKYSKKKKPMEEGCLSVRWLYGFVERSEKVVLRAQDENGRTMEVGASGLMAQIFQHEVDHLEGILFIDKAKDLKDIPPPPKKTVSKKSVAGKKKNTKQKDAEA